MRRRLVGVTLATTSMIALAFVLPLSLLIRDVAEERALARGRQVVDAVAPVLLTGDPDALEAALSGTDPGLSVSVVLPDGSVVGAPPPGDVALEDASAGAASVQRTVAADVLVTPVIRPGVGTSVVVVAVPDELQRRGVATAWVVLAGLALVLVTGAVVLADRLGRSVTGPAAHVVQTARRLGGGDLTARADPAGPPEVADIAVALNQLADRIHQLVRAEREAVADLSHRLRTPLTALRLDVDAVSDPGDRRRLAADLAAVERRVERLVREARAGAETAGTVAVTDVVPLVRERAAWWSALAEDQGRRATLQVRVPAAPVASSRDALADAVDALLGNVFAHTPEGTPYTVAVEGGDGAVRVVVADGGPGLPVDVGPDRGDSRSGSTGLGLDIARRVAEQAGGRLDLGRPAGGGAEVAVVLPIHQLDGREAGGRR